MQFCFRFFAIRFQSICVEHVYNAYVEKLIFLQKKRKEIRYRVLWFEKTVGKLNTFIIMFMILHILFHFLTGMDYVGTFKCFFNGFAKRRSITLCFIISRAIIVSLLIFHCRWSLPHCKVPKIHLNVIISIFIINLLQCFPTYS